jgi:hypothetical protein
LLKIEGVEWNIESVGNAARVLGIGSAAATLLMVEPRGDDRERRWQRWYFSLRRASRRTRFPMAHEDANHVVPLLAQKMGRDAAVDATGHGKHNARHELVMGKGDWRNRE